MEEQDIQPIRPQALQARVDGAHDVAARSAACVDVGTLLAVALGGDHQLVAMALDQAAQDLLGFALAVLVGRVEEVDPGVPD